MAKIGLLRGGSESFRSFSSAVRRMVDSLSSKSRSSDAGKFDPEQFIEKELRSVVASISNDRERRQYDMYTNEEMRCKEAVSGSAEVRYRLGGYYSDEETDAYDLKKAFQCYYKAAVQGQAEAMYAVGRFYYEGWVVGYNLIEAENWYRRAAEKGLAKAEWGMEHILFGYLAAEHNRTGGRSNARTEYIEKEMLYWRKRAAAHGHPDAVYELGLAYMEGIDVEQDERAGLKMIIKAADTGCEEAMESLNENFYRQLRRKYNI